MFTNCFTPPRFVSGLPFVVPATGTSTARKTMRCDDKSLSHFPQHPLGSMGRRNVEVKGEESHNERVELTFGLKTSKPEMCKNGLFDSPSPLSLSPATAAAQTQMPSTKPKARTLVTCRQLSGGNEAVAVRSPLPLLTLKGTVSVARSDDSRRSASLHASITGKASLTADRQHEEQRLKRSQCNINREGNKSQYDRELWLQVKERKQQIERERSKNLADELKHNETMQHSIWGMPGSGAPNYHLGTMKRTRSLHTAGILPQEQIRDKGFSGTPFRCL